MKSALKTLRQLAAALTVVALSTTVVATSATAANPNLVTNASFEAFGTSGPTSWGTWTPSGTATYTQVPGRDGSGAVQIATGTTTSRGFLVQDAAVPGTVKKLRLTFWQKKGTLTGTGKAGVRVTFPGTPTQFYGTDAATAWRQVTAHLDVPAGATSVRVEPMVDGMQGSMQLDDIDFSVYDEASNLASNGSFEAFPGAVPDAWGRWNAAGTGTVSKTDGYAGTNALRIKTDTTSSRLALTQDITLPAGGGTFKAEFFSRIASISGTGKAGLRIDVLDGGGGSSFIGRNTPTSGWQKSSGLFTVPAAATRIRLHAFNDAVQGTMDIDDIQVSPSTVTAGLATATTEAGDIGLNWTVAAPTGTPARFDIHRGPAGSPVTADASTLIRSVPASLLQATDVEWLPSTEYKYVVIARDAAGAEVARTNESSILSPAADTTATSYLSVTSDTVGTHLGWRAVGNAKLPLTAVGHTEAITAANVSSARTAATGLSRFGGTSTQEAGGHFALVDANGTLLATASRAALQHPRIGLTTDVLAKINRLIGAPGTPQDAWNTIKARVEGGMATFGSSADRYAREAAFVYQVTGEARYAAMAYDAFVAAANATPFTAKQDLDTANPVSQLALTYDWAYNGWTDAQRAFAVEYFERTAVFFEFAKHPNIILPDKASNWVGVVRGAELAQHLAVRGDAGYGMRDTRIGTLVDQLRQHLETAHTEHGWFQEGLEYLDYTQMMSMPGIRGSIDVGIDALKHAWMAPDTANLLLHTVSLRQPNNRLQWGVAGANNSTAWPLYLGQAKTGELAPMIEIFERVNGHRATTKFYSPGFITQGLIDWPESVPAGEEYDPAKVYPAILDDEAGSYSFRNRIVDADDVLVQLNNRNHSHLGWAGDETFGISMISHDATWATQPGKSVTAANKYSRVLVDNKPDQAEGNGRTLASKTYEGQGGGYVSLDGSANFQVRSATREAVVDMTDHGDADALLAFHDRFTDTASHTWAWQLAPEAGVTVDYETIGTTIQFTFRKGQSWLRGWLQNAQGATAAFTDGSFRITRTGTSAEFDIVLAVGNGTSIPIAETEGSKISVSGATIDTANLNTYQPGAAKNLTAPVLSGEPDVGQTLNATSGTWNETSLTFSYQWQRNGADITGATTPAYTLAAEDQGQDITAVVTATGEDRLRTSAASPPVTVRYATTTTATVKRKTGVSWQEYDVAISVSSPGGDLSGPVVVTAGDFTATGTVDSNGMGLVTLPPLPKGTYSVVATYQGNSTTSVSPSASDTLRIVV
ncbi:hypothetical protein ACFVYC_09790 [Pseudarthrobacter sp. NPDC058329]|uniref:hypothetical protein n=1 Tax=Pseudarthrobacter sp. NPDC058329 TaxID=3346448 RepID=UPI0036DE0A5D